VALGNGPAIGALNITITGANYGVEDSFTFKNIKGMLRAGDTASDSSYWCVNLLGVTFTSLD
jgi:hypothetical protein